MAGAGGRGEGEPGCGAVPRTERMGREAVGSTGAWGSWCHGGLGWWVWVWVRSWDCGAGVEEKEILWQWVWGVGTWESAPLSGYSVQGSGEGETRVQEGRGDCWPHYWDVLNLGGA